MTAGWRSRLGLWVVIFACGCGQSHAMDEVRAPSIRIPVAPLAMSHLYVDGGFSPLDFEAPEAPLMHGEGAVLLALGEGYPRVALVNLEGLVRGRCSTPDGAIRITSISGGGEGLTVEQRSDSLLEIGTTGLEGETTFRVLGTFTPDVPFRDRGCWSDVRGLTRVDFDMVLTVRSREVRGVAYEYRCSSLMFFTGASLQGVRYVALDGEGREMWPANVEHFRAVEVTLSARDRSDLALAGPPEIASVRLPATETFVDIVPRVGDSLAIGVVDPTRVEELEPVFWLEGYGPLLTIDSGTTLDAADLEPMAYGDRVFMSPGSDVRVDGEQVCSAVPLDRFELVSETVSTCASFPVPAGRFFPPTGGAVVGGARLESDGRCELRWSAPSLANGSGLRGAVDVNLVNVDTLQHFE